MENGSKKRLNNYEKNKERIKKLKLERQELKKKEKEKEKCENEEKINFNLKKYALCIGYIGSQYRGCQGQGENCATIENELERILLKINAIKKKKNFKNFNFCLSRSARTDQGVHALFNIFVYNIDLSCIGKKIEEGDNIDVTHNEKDNMGDKGNDTQTVGDNNINNNDEIFCENIKIEKNDQTQKCEEDIFKERKEKEEKFKNLLNNHLPCDIKCFEIYKVTKSFDARKFCSFRFYEYLFPVYVLSEVQVNEKYKERFDQAIEDIDEYVQRCKEEKRARRNKERNEMGITNIERNEMGITNKERNEMGITNIERNEMGIINIKNNNIDITNKERNDNDITNEENENMYLQIGDNINSIPIHTYNNSKDIHCDNDKTERSSVIKNIKRDIIDEDIFSIKHYKEDLNEEELNTFFDIFNNYVGYHNFHCFTKKNIDQTTYRYIKYFDVSTVKLFDYHFLSVKILGQSFLMHQIRKMITLAVETYRKATSINSIYYCLHTKNYIPITLFPSDGLMLICPYFNAYNEKVCKYPHTLPICFEETEDIMEFKKNKIGKCIIEKMKQNVWKEWLQRMNQHPFIYYFIKEKINSSL
ncbi:putative U2 snRNA/tRNA pseudouridine synthase [Plasmodium gaboni]|uniref:Putative U2 snRNA/tRNA pseudouridine synthase n=1 Tax=Plasmodium gaboni TaxID=647221 RepID=A0A151LN90_9APIC|nr:putative U2 snRNA/tRNA pseudouridine synthase [Plasmodium gaboni]KYO00648.1 putative U2 snRNA/tRNA pseudouridine synthase [Plasmodium gaboni]